MSQGLPSRPLPHLSYYDYYLVISCRLTPAVILYFSYLHTQNAQAFTGKEKRHRKKKKQEVLLDKLIINCGKSKVNTSGSFSRSFAMRFELSQFPMKS